MLRLVVTIVAAVSLGAHAFGGCCWSHIWHDDRCALAAGHAADHDGELCDDIACCNKPSQHQHDHGPCKCHCRGLCNYLPTAKVQCENPDTVGNVVFLPSCEVGIELTHPAVSPELAHLTPTAALPLRLHLWNQILLV